MQIVFMVATVEHNLSQNWISILCICDSWRFLVSVCSKRLRLTHYVVSCLWKLMPAAIDN